MLWADAGGTVSISPRRSRSSTAFISTALDAVPKSEAAAAASSAEGDRPSARAKSSATLAVGLVLLASF